MLTPFLWVLGDLWNRRSRPPPTYRHIWVVPRRHSLALRVLDVKANIPLYWLRGLTGSSLDHRSLPPEFESRSGHIWRLFHLWLCFITFGGRSAHLAYHMHKSGRKTSIINIYSHRLISTCQKVSILWFSTLKYLLLWSNHLFSLLIVVQSGSIFMDSVSCSTNVIPGWSRV